MANYFQMPEFNFRLRRALNPFESQITPRTSYKKSPWDSIGSMFEENSWDSQEDSSPYRTQGLPDFSNAMPDYSQMYEDVGPATRRYQSHLDESPRMQDYAPSKWRRLGAILAGVGAGFSGGNGYETAREVALDPYKTAYTDWMGRGQGLKESATIEEAAANKKATLHQKILSDYMDQQRWKADYEIKLRGAKTAEERNEITRAYNEAMTAYRAEQNRLTGARDTNTAAHYQRSDANAATANNLRRYGIETQKYGIEAGKYNASKQRELSERLGATGAVTGGSQQATEELARDYIFQEVISRGLNPKDYFTLNEDDLPIMLGGIGKRSLPDELYIKYQNYRNQSLGLAGRR